MNILPKKPFNQNTVTSDSEKFPFVTIGSKVKSELESGKKELRLVNPIQTSVDDNAIPLISGGKSFNIKKLRHSGSNGPRRKFRYKVEAIEFP